MLARNSDSSSILVYGAQHRTERFEPTCDHHPYIVRAYINTCSFARTNTQFGAIRIGLPEFYSNCKFELNNLL